MTWKMYIFVKTKSSKGIKLSKGKIAGQVGHACMRLGKILGDVAPRMTTYSDYVKDGEIKLVFRCNADTNEFPKLGSLDPALSLLEYYTDLVFREVDNLAWSKVKDNMTGEYIAWAILTNRPLDTKEFMLL